LKLFILKKLLTNCADLLSFSQDRLQKEVIMMRKLQMVSGVVGLVLILVAGCTPQLCPADKNLLNQALESSESAAQSEKNAEAAAAQAEDAAMQAKESAASAQEAASQAEAAADKAEQSAAKAAKAFEMGLQK
jgi:hypothetical protein